LLPPDRAHSRAAALLAGLALLLGTAPGASHAQQADTSGTRQVDIIASDSLAGSERQRRLIGSVSLRQGATRLRADRATQYLNESEILFTGNVLITEEGDSLWADRVRYDSRQKVGRATGEVRVSSGGEVLLAGPVGRYFFDEKRALFPRRVTLVDSTRVLKSRGGEYFSRAERAEFYRRVRVFSDSTYLEADSVTYRRRREITKARGNVFIERRGDRASPEEEDVETQRATPNVGAQRAVPDTGASPDPARTDTPAAPTERPSLPERPSLLGRRLPVDTTRRALLPDTTARTLLWGKRAYNDPQNGYSRVTGRALLVRLQPPDSTEADAAAASQTRPDTLIVRARRLETARSDTLRRLTATDSVRLWQQDLQAVGDSAVYDQRPEAERRRARGERPEAERKRARGARPEALPDSLARADSSLAGADSSLASTDSSLASADSSTGGSLPPRRESRFFGDPFSWNPGTGGSAGARPEGTPPPGRSTSAPRSGRSRTVGTQLSGDSLRVTGHGEGVRRLFARGNAFLAQEDSVLEGRFQQLKGGRITARLTRNAAGETTLRRLSAGPNAELIYFRKKRDSTLSAAIRASGDTAIFKMRGGTLRKLRMPSPNEGTAFRKAENVPDSFRLDGFVWVPGRRPRKNAFLNEKRVRRRLVRPEPPRPAEPPRESPPAEPPPTTAAGDDTGDG